MNKSPKILIIGNFGYAKNQLDGQTIKTRNLVYLLQELGFQKVDVIDTSFRLNTLRILKIAFKKQLIFFTGANASFTVVFPFVWLFSKLSKSELHYIHIGSELASFIKDKTFYQFLLNSIHKNYTETEKIKQGLLPFISPDKLVVLPNSRITDFEPSLTYKQSSKLRLVYLGRILKEKGIDLIFDLYPRLLAYFENEKLEIHFYGQLVDKSLNFKERIGEMKGYKYFGALEPKDIYTTISKYDALLFPTYYENEGFPGTLLDAYLAGIPSIASDWLYNSEIIKNGEDGLLFESKNVVSFAMLIEELINTPQIQETLHKGVMIKREQFDYKHSLKILNDSISPLFRP